MKVVILDHIKNIQLDEDNPPLDNYQALDYLPIGSYVLATTIREEEVRLYKGKVDMSLLASSGREFERDALFACYFNWFSTSIVNYLKLIGLVDIMNQQHWTSSNIKDPKNMQAVSEHCTKYVNEAIPQILLWRNKIAAHYAITAPRKDDNLATLEYSIMNPISYKKPYFWMGKFSWSTHGTTSNLSEWSLTETYETLTPRLWPHLKLPELKIS